MTYPLPTNYGTNSAVSATALNNIGSLINLLWVLDAGDNPPGARVATTGSETYTITSGNVTQINGTTIDGVSVAATGAINGFGDYVLVKDAPTVSGVGSPGSTVPANGLYQVSAVGSNITLVRATFMSAAGPLISPAGVVIFVAQGTVNAGLAWQVQSPASVSTAFTYGATNIGFGTQILFTPTGAFTLTNKRITKRVSSIASSATPAFNTDNFDVGKITALATNITSWTITGTPQDADEFWLRIKDNGSVRLLTGWSWAITNGYTSFPNSTVPGKTLTMHFMYDSAVPSWVLMAADVIGY